MTEGQKLEALAKEHGAPWPMDPTAMMETAMCLWEAYIDAEIKKGPQSWRVERIREANQGTCQLRLNLMAVVDQCHIGWYILNDDSVTFDWDYVPLFLANCIEWSADRPLELKSNWVEIIKG